MEHLLLVDGMNLLWQMFCGMPARIQGRDGWAIQGTLGFVGALIKMIKMTSPSHLAVLFDSEQENARAALLPEYKANRVYEDVPEEESPFSQLADVYRALDYMGIAHTEILGVEADDAIAAYALGCGAAMRVTVASLDSDFFQLINENVRVLRYRGDKSRICDAEYLREKCGVLPEQYADFKALTGDSSDNIRGAEQVGPKTAAALLREFGSLREILARAGEIKRPGIRASVLRSRERLQTNYRLIKLDDSACLPFEPAQLAYAYDGSVTMQVLAGIGLK